MSRTREYISLYVSPESYEEAADLPRINYGLRYNKDETLEEFTAKEESRRQEYLAFVENVELQKMDKIDCNGRDVPYSYVEFTDDMQEDGFDFHYGGK